MALTSTGLTDIGMGPGFTTNFHVQYENTLSSQANVIANANALLGVMENEFNVTTGWFQTPGGKFGIGSRQVVNLNLPDTATPAGVNFPGANNQGYGSAINLDAQNLNSNAATAAERVKMVFIAEWVEILMSLSGGKWNAGDSMGEGLSQYCSIVRFQTGHYAYYGSWVDQWLNKQPRQDWVSKTEGTDRNAISFGCALAFIFYLNKQLNFSITQIIAAGAPNLAAVYANLRGESGSPFPLFVDLLEHVFPSSANANVPGPITDNPFPVGANIDGLLLQDRKTDPVRVIFGKAWFEVPDSATRARLFPGVQVDLLNSRDLNAIGQIPIDGTLLREESSTQVYVMVSGFRQRAPAGVAGKVHVLWDGALAKIPILPGNLSGVVTDTHNTPLNDASVIIKAGFIISPGTGNTEQLSTDSAGRYSFTSLPSGAYDVTAEKGGFVPASASVTVLDGVPLTHNFALAPTVPFTISGHVTDTAGAPIAGATITLTQDSPVLGRLTTVTDSTGQYSVTMDPGLFNGDYTIDAVAAGFTSTSITMPIPNGAMLTENLTLARQGILTGKVTDVQGTPLGGAKVAVGSHETFTDAAGMYRIMLDPGPYAATASAPNAPNPGFTSSTVSVTMPIGTTITQNFALAKTVPGTITGTVTDDDGSTLPRAKVTAGSVSTTTNNSGQYTLSNVRPGPTQITASAGGHLSERDTVTVISNQTITVDFVLTRRIRTPF